MALSMNKKIMVIFNTFWFILGGGLITLGVFGNLESSTVESYVTVIGNYTASPWKSFMDLWIAIGFFFVVTGLFGCIGLYCDKGWLVKVYAGLTVIITVLAFAAAGLGYQYREDLDSNVQQRMLDTLKEAANTTFSPGDKKFMDAWDDVQKSEGCCGVTSDLDWPSRPASCKDYTHGCLDKIKDTLSTYKTVTQGVLGVAFALTLMLSLSLTRRIEHYSESCYEPL